MTSTSPLAHAVVSLHVISSAKIWVPSHSMMIRPADHSQAFGVLVLT
jgi:hypothetical protein